jgi:hypothetical protein
VWPAGMRRRRDIGRDPGYVVFGTIGWLFADLMFALAMAFLVATTIGQPPIPSHPRPSPTPTPSATATPKPVLELKPLRIHATVNWQGLLSGSERAQAALQRRVQSVATLHGRRAGLVLTFGGASGDGPGEAVAIARKVDSALQALGRRRFVFSGTVFRPFLSLGAPPSQVEIDIYLFKQ